MIAMRLLVAILSTIMVHLFLVVACWLHAVKRLGLVLFVLSASSVAHFFLTSATWRRHATLFFQVAFYYNILSFQSKAFFSLAQLDLFDIPIAVRLCAFQRNAFRALSPLLTIFTFDQSHFSVFRLSTFTLESLGQ